MRFNELLEYKIIAGPTLPSRGTPNVPVPLYSNPTFNEFLELVKQFTEMRGLFHSITNDIVIWDAYRFALHSDIVYELGWERKSEEVYILNGDINPSADEGWTGYKQFNVSSIALGTIRIIGKSNRIVLSEIPALKNRYIPNARQQGLDIQEYPGVTGSEGY